MAARRSQHARFVLFRAPKGVSLLTSPISGCVTEQAAEPYA